MKHVQLICLALAFCVVSTSAQIALKIESPTITGELTNSPFKDQIEITSFSQAVNILVTAGGGGGGGSPAGTPQPADIIITKPLDRSSPELFLRAHQASAFGKMTFTFHRPVGGTNQIYYQVQLEDVLITSLSQTSGGDRPVESLSLNYLKIKWTYNFTSNNVPVSITRGWNYQSNQSYN